MPGPLAGEIDISESGNRSEFAEPAAAQADTASLGGLLERFQKARREQKLARVAMLDVLKRCQTDGTAIRIRGYPSTVTMPQFDDDGKLVHRVTVACGPLNRVTPKKERLIEEGRVADVSEGILGGIVSVAPVGQMSSWDFGLSNILEMEAVSPEPAERRATL